MCHLMMTSLSTSAKILDIFYRSFQKTRNSQEPPTSYCWRSHTCKGSRGIIRWGGTSVGTRSFSLSEHKQPEGEGNPKRQSLAENIHTAFKMPLSSFEVLIFRLRPLQLSAQLKLKNDICASLALRSKLYLWVVGGRILLKHEDCHSSFLFRNKWIYVNYIFASNMCKNQTSINSRSTSIFCFWKLSFSETSQFPIWILNTHRFQFKALVDWCCHKHKENLWTWAVLFRTIIQQTSTRSISPALSKFLIELWFPVQLQIQIFFPLL